MAGGKVGQYAPKADANSVENTTLSVTGEAFE